MPEASRQKYWGELTLEEKIERMRGIIKELGEDYNRINKMINEFREHRHNDSGESIIIRKLNFSSNQCERSRPEPLKDDIYF